MKKNLRLLQWEGSYPLKKIYPPYYWRKPIKNAIPHIRYPNIIIYHPNIIISFKNVISYYLINDISIHYHYDKLIQGFRLNFLLLRPSWLLISNPSTSFFIIHSETLSWFNNLFQSIYLHSLRTLGEYICFHSSLDQQQMWQF